MKYVPLNNRPNVTETRFQSVSPSVQLDSRNFPHIAWLERKFDVNEVGYSFWDGQKWSYKIFPPVFISEQEIVATPNSLVLDRREEPVIAFSRKSADASTSTLTLASHNDEWLFN